MNFFVLGEGVVVTTGQDNKYDQFWFTIHDRTSLAFRVQGCSDVRLALSELPGIFSSDTYEVIIGGSANSMYAIKDVVGGGTVATSQRTDILDCLAFSDFWISWTNGKVAVSNLN